MSNGAWSVSNMSPIFSDVEEIRYGSVLGDTLMVSSLNSFTFTLFSMRVAVMNVNGPFVLGRKVRTVSFRWKVLIQVFRCLDALWVGPGLLISSSTFSTALLSDATTNKPSGYILCSELNSTVAYVQNSSNSLAVALAGAYSDVMISGFFLLRLRMTDVILASIACLTDCMYGALDRLIIIATP